MDVRFLKRLSRESVVFIHRERERREQCYNFKETLERDCRERLLYLPIERGRKREREKGAILQF